MNITRDMDSFDVLQVKEDATVEEIKESLRYHVEMFCGENGGKKNADGDYLADIYYEHYKRLMNKEERAKLIEKRRNKVNFSDILLRPYENALVVPRTLEEKEHYIITSINKEIIERYSKNESKTSFSLKKINFKKVSLKNTYVVVGQDCSLIFANSIYCASGDTERKNPVTGKAETLKDAPSYKMSDCFTTQNIFGELAYFWFEIPWAQGQIFKVNGILSIAFLASKIFPNFLVHNGKIKDRDFRKVYDIIYRYLKENSSYVSSLFEDVDEEEVNKKML